MQRLMFASALVFGAFASQASAVQDLPGYDLYRGAGAPSSFYAEGFAGYPGSYGAGMYVAGYGYAGNGYSGMGGPCCGERVLQGACNPWAGYVGRDLCWGKRLGGHHGGRGCGAKACCVSPAIAPGPLPAASCDAGECDEEPACCDAKPCRKFSFNWKGLFGRKSCAADCCKAEGCGGDSGCCGDGGSEMTDEGDAVDSAPSAPTAPTLAPAPAPVTET